VSEAVVYNFSYVVTNQVKVVAFGSQKLLPMTDV